MRSWLTLGLLLGFSCTVWAQQPPSPNSSPASASGNQDSSSANQNSSAKPAGGAAGAPAGGSPAQPIGDSAKNLNVPNMPPPRSDRVHVDELGSGVGDSSSKDEQIDLSPPGDDAKAHPKSSEAVADAEVARTGITEFKTWDPHKAAKDVEVGDFYFKRKNYRAAEDRYREALRYKDNDAIATIRLAECLEKLGILDEARVQYENYLTILPHGPEAMEAQKAIARLTKEQADEPR